MVRASLVTVRRDLADIARLAGALRGVRQVLAVTEECVLLDCVDHAPDSQRVVAAGYSLTLDHERLDWRLDGNAGPAALHGSIVSYGDSTFCQLQSTLCMVGLPPLQTHAAHRQFLTTLVSHLERRRVAESPPARLSLPPDSRRLSGASGVAMGTSSHHTVGPAGLGGNPGSANHAPRPGLGTPTAPHRRPALPSRSACDGQDARTVKLAEIS